MLKRLSGPALTLLVGAVLFGVALHLAGWLPTLWRSADDGSIDYMIAEGQAAYRRIPLQPIGDQASFVAALENAGWQNGELATPSEKSALLNMIGEFLYYRFGQTSPDTYRIWRESDGSRMKTAAELTQYNLLQSSHNFYFNTDLPADFVPARLFPLFWNAGTDHGGGLNRLTRIAATSDGLLIALGYITEGNPSGPAISTGGMSSELWYGRTSSTMHGWFVPPTSKDEFLRAGRRVLRAEVGIVCEFARGPRRPLLITCFLNPDTRRWCIDCINQCNVAPQELTGLEY